MFWEFYLLFIKIVVIWHACCNRFLFCQKRVFEWSSSFHVKLLWHENSSYTIEQWIPLPLIPYLSEPTQDFPHLPEYLPCDLGVLINAVALERLHVLVVVRPLCLGERVNE